jgi:membrane protein required for beta-lactamase induction
MEVQLPIKCSTAGHIKDKIVDIFFFFLAWLCSVTVGLILCVILCNYQMLNGISFCSITLVFGIIIPVCFWCIESGKLKFHCVRG